MKSIELALKPPFDTTIAEVLSECASQTPARVLFDFGNFSFTVEQIFNAAFEIRGKLFSEGIERGHTIATCMETSPQYIKLIFALFLIGIKWVPIDPKSRGPSLEHTIKTSQPNLILGYKSSLKYVSELCLDCKIVELESWPTKGTNAFVDLKYEKSSSDDHSLIVFTSGTSGPPKGVIVTDRMILASAAGAALASDCSCDDNFLFWEPLHHISGVQALIMALVYGVKLTLVSRFSASNFWELASSKGITKLHYLGGILEILLSKQVSKEENKHRIKLAFGGGCRPEIWRKFTQRFGIPINEVYGMTEASSFTTINTAGVIGSCGLAVPWLDVKILNDSGSSVPLGKVGEIFVKSKYPALLTPGYLNDQEATSKLYKFNMLSTGDIGRFLPNGSLQFLGRNSDSIRHKGQNISAWEVESGLSLCSLVAECAVVGVEAEIGEQDIYCFVIPNSKENFELHSLDKWAIQNLPPHHVPKYWQLVDEFPRTPSHRIRKDLLDISFEKAEMSHII
tara:strand:+ start:71 stop:1600 length:1530 start_codon:yes stop_codon:yes gene_type:complete